MSEMLFPKCDCCGTHSDEDGVIHHRVGCPKLRCTARKDGAFTTLRCILAGGHDGEHNFCVEHVQEYGPGKGGRRRYIA